MHPVAPYRIARTPAIQVGASAADVLPGLVDRRGAVLITDAAVVDYANRLAATIHYPVRVHTLAAGEPTTASVDGAADAVRVMPDAVVVGIGGGAALDTAKQAAAVAAGRQSVEHYALCAHPFPGRRQIVAVPTTSGTGSEVTRTCVFTNSAGRKMWTWGDELMADLVILDPVAAATMPTSVTATSGLDAVVHAIEAASGRRSNAIVVGLAAQALRLADDALPRAVADGSDLHARQAMQEAATLAGLVIDGAGTGVAHCLGHAIGTLAAVPHGLAVAVALRATLAWTVAGAAPAFAGLRRGFADPLESFVALTEAVDLAGAAARFGPLEASARALAETMVAPENQPMLQNNARDAAEHCGELSEMFLTMWAQLAGSR